MKVRCLTLIVCFLSAVPSFAAPSLTDPNLQVEQVVSGLSFPTNMAFIGENDILVLQKGNGRVRRVINGVLQAGHVLDVAVDSSSERGLLGIALHPDFPATPSIYIYYTESSTGVDDGAPAGNRVYRYTWDGGALVNPELILGLPVLPGANHNGGIITFGPDGKLYVIIGDLNRDGQLQNFSGGPAPDDTGVILRLNDDGSIPGDNPFFSSADPENPLGKYYAYGIRNSFGMTFDPVSGELWDTENGVSTFDEINLVERGFNSGWEKIMGPLIRNSNDEGDLVAFTGSHYADPKFSWFDTVGPTAIVFLNSTALGAQYENDVFVGDINNGNLYRFEPNFDRDGFIFAGAGLADLVADNAGQLNELIFGTAFSGITDLKVGPDGLLYVLSMFDGAIYRISPAPAPLFFGASSLPDAEEGVGYGVDLGIGGGTYPYTIEVVKGSLPTGLLPDATGISGTPSRAKKFSFSLRVTDDAGASATKRFKIKVFKALSIATETLKSGTVNKKYKARIQTMGGKKPYHWALISGTLPDALELDESTGRITGTPLSPVTVDLTFEVTDSLGVAEQRSYTLTIN